MRILVLTKGFVEALEDVEGMISVFVLFTCLGRILLQLLIDVLEQVRQAKVAQMATVAIIFVQKEALVPLDGQTRREDILRQVCAKHDIIKVVLIHVMFCGEPVFPSLGFGLLRCKFLSLGRRLGLSGTCTFFLLGSTSSFSWSCSFRFL